MTSDLEIPPSPPCNRWTKTSNQYRRQTWRQFVETLDHKSDHSKLWRTIKAMDGKSAPKAKNEVITFKDSQVSSPNQITDDFNRQLTTSKLGIHISSRETRLVSREIKLKALASAVTFSTNQVTCTKGISNCSNIRAFRPDNLCEPDQVCQLTKGDLIPHITLQ